MYLKNVTSRRKQVNWFTASRYPFPGRHKNWCESLNAHVLAHKRARSPRKLILYAWVRFLKNLLSMSQCEWGIYTCLWIDNYLAFFFDWRNFFTRQGRMVDEGELEWGFCTSVMKLDTCVPRTAANLDSKVVLSDVPFNFLWNLELNVFDVNWTKQRMLFN